jgi:8-oxo-dGTP pyrophosphatase MutT (NUDIX family)
VPDDVIAPAPAATRPRAVFARHAASLLVWRRGGAGVAVLMGTRGAGHRFMPNRLVFPGGAVDPGDATAAVATPLPPATLAMLQRAAPPRLAQALAVAAARELEEETALSLGTPPALDGLAYLCRAVTPPGRGIRFNARFLAVAEARVSGTLAGSGELENLRYYDVAEALLLDLHPVQRGALERLLTWVALTGTQRWSVRETEVFREMKWRRDLPRGNGHK